MLTLRTSTIGISGEYPIVSTTKQDETIADSLFDLNALPMKKNTKDCEEKYLVISNISR